MFGWWISMGIAGLAVLALTPNYVHRRQRRAQVAHVRAQVESWLSAPKQPVNASSSPDRGIGRCGAAVVPDDLDSDTTARPLKEAS